MRATLSGTPGRLGARKGLGIACVLAAVAGTTAPSVGLACGWSWETYDAEATSLPCVYDAVVGYYPKHTAEYHEAVIRAVDYARTWVPGWTAGLDAKGLSELHLGRLDAATSTLEHRHHLAKDAYAGHANLGTLYTFTGDHDLALAHVDAALSIEPKAHFGREKYHRKLVLFLRDVAEDPKAAATRNFLGPDLTTAQRVKGSKDAYAAAGFTDDAIDALVSMIAVYGAEDVAEIYLTLGELLALRGFPKLAWTAYTRAIELGHPRKAELRRWRTEVTAAFPTRSGGGGSSAGRRAVLDPFDGNTRVAAEHGGGFGLETFYATRRADAESARRDYARWEKAQIAAGMPVWTEDGVHRLYARMNQIRLRCRAPSIIDALEPLAPAATPAEPNHSPVPCPMCDWKSRARMDAKPPPGPEARTSAAGGTAPAPAPAKPAPLPHDATRGAAPGGF